MKALWDLPDRLAILGLSLLAGVLFIAVLSLSLPAGGAAAVMILDHNAVMAANSPFVYPFTVQNLMHLLFFVGLGEVWCQGERA
jgi:hypothetical protein